MAYRLRAVARSEGGGMKAAVLVEGGQVRGRGRCRPHRGRVGARRGEGRGRLRHRAPLHGGDDPAARATASSSATRAPGSCSRRRPASAVAPGDRVAVYNMVGCGSCRPCLSQRESLCVEPVGPARLLAPRRLRGRGARARAQSGPAPRRASPSRPGALLACSGMSAVHASRLAGVALGDTVVVDGVGGVGLMAVQVGLAAGARVIAVADTEERARLAADAGAAETIVLERRRGLRRPPRPRAGADGRRGSRPLRRARRHRADAACRHPVARAEAASS